MSNIQELLVRAIEQKLEGEKDWREKLANKLFLSKSTIYKRLNGITPFTPEEISVLIQEFGISFDALALREYNNRVVFKVPPTHQKINTFDEYLHGVEKTFRPIEHYNQVKVFIMTRDLPLFYHFRNLDVALFKLYAYGRSMWDLDSCLHRPFSLEEMYLIPDIQARINRIWDRYAELDTVEYWQTSAIDVSFQQLQFFLEAGAVPAPQAFRVLEGLAQIVEDVKKMNIKGTKTLSGKTEGGTLELYHNRIMSTENIILATTDEQNALHIVLDPSRFIVTFDPMMTETAQRTIQQAKKNAYHLGVGSGNVREEFFNNINRKIEQMRKKIDIASQAIVL
jgi:hypothetical protein